jgi:hypothetical protein
VQLLQSTMMLLQPGFFFTKAFDLRLAEEPGGRDVLKDCGDVSKDCGDVLKEV